MTKEEIEEAARDNWDSINVHFINELNPYAHRVGFIEGANWVLQSENVQLKAERECKQVTADYLYKDWLKATKRTGSVLLGSSVRDFIQYLDSHFKITTTP